MARGLEVVRKVLVGVKEACSGPTTILLLATMMLYVAANSGDLTYLYTRYNHHCTPQPSLYTTTITTGRLVFDWDEGIYTRVSTLTSLLASAASLFLLPFLR